MIKKSGAEGAALFYHIFTKRNPGYFHNPGSNKLNSSSSHLVENFA